MRKLRLLRATSGFTLIETTIVLALIALITVVLIGGAGNATRIERFRSEVAIFTSRLREAKTKSYTVQTANAPWCRYSVPPYDAGSKGCIWRGVKMHYQVASPYTQSLIYGSDFSSSGNVSNNITSTCIPVDPRECLHGVANSIDYDQGTNGLNIESIKIDTSPAFTAPVTVSNISIAFLAPSGAAYVNCQDVVSVGYCGVGDWSSVRYFDDNRHLVRFHLTDAAVNISADVTFDPASATIITDFK